MMPLWEVPMYRVLDLHRIAQSAPTPSRIMGRVYHIMTHQGFSGLFKSVFKLEEPLLHSQMPQVNPRRRIGVAACARG